MPTRTTSERMIRRLRAFNLVPKDVEVRLERRNPRGVTVNWTAWTTKKESYVTVLDKCLNVGSTYRQAELVDVPWRIVETDEYTYIEPGGDFA